MVLRVEARPPRAPLRQEPTPMRRQDLLRPVRKRRTRAPAPAGPARRLSLSRSQGPTPPPPPPTSLTAATAPPRPQQTPPPPGRNARPPRPARRLLAERVTSAGFKAGFRLRLGAAAKSFRLRRKPRGARDGGGGGGGW